MRGKALRLPTVVFDERTLPLRVCCRKGATPPSATLKILGGAGIQDNWRLTPSETPAHESKGRDGRM
jgi:hypothetical protein